MPFFPPVPVLFKRTVYVLANLNQLFLVVQEALPWVVHGSIID
jgi:hypothetical protein